MEFDGYVEALSTVMRGLVNGCVWGMEPQPLRICLCRVLRTHLIVKWKDCRWMKSGN